MKMLYILKTPPSESQKTLMKVIATGSEVVEFPMYEGGVDYDKLVDLIVECDKAVTWW